MHYETSQTKKKSICEIKELTEVQGGIKQDVFCLYRRLSEQHTGAGGSLAGLKCV